MIDSEVLVGTVVGLAVGFWAGSLIFKKRDKESLAEQKAREHEEMMQKARAFLSGKDEVTNDELQHHLGVSDASATRYLDEMEKAGQLKQVGKTGHAVTYKVL